MYARGVHLLLKSKSWVRALLLEFRLFAYHYCFFFVCLFSFLLSSFSISFILFLCRYYFVCFSLEIFSFQLKHNQELATQVTPRNACYKWWCYRLMGFLCVKLTGEPGKKLFPVTLLELLWFLCKMIAVEICIAYGSMALFITLLNNVFLLYYVDLFLSVYRIDKASFWIGEVSQIIFFFDRVNLNLSSRM